MYSSIAKDTSRAEMTSNSEKIKPIVLAIISLKAASQSASQLVSQSVENSEAFLVNLKACLGLILHNQYCPVII